MVLSNKGISNYQTLILGHQHFDGEHSEPIKRYDEF